MQVYTETTDGSSIEPKESALVWHYLDADHDFGSCQAKELQDHLERVLSNEPVVVKCGHYIVEVKPQVCFLGCAKHFVISLPCWLHRVLTEQLITHAQGVSKGLAVDKLIRTLVNNGKAPDFLMCIGNDRSDEDMFESINSMTSNTFLSPTVPEVFACSVGQKPSKAKYYVDDTSEVIRLLKKVTCIS